MTILAILTLAMFRKHLFLGLVLILCIIECLGFFNKFHEFACSQNATAFKMAAIHSSAKMDTNDKNFNVTPFSSVNVIL